MKSILKLLSVMFICSYIPFGNTTEGNTLQITMKGYAKFYGKNKPFKVLNFTINRGEVKALTLVEQKDKYSNSKSRTQKIYVAYNDFENVLAIDTANTERLFSNIGHLIELEGSWFNQNGKTYRNILTPKGSYGELNRTTVRVKAL